MKGETRVSFPAASVLLDLYACSFVSRERILVNECRIILVDYLNLIFFKIWTARYINGWSFIKAKFFFRITACVSFPRHKESWQLRIQIIISLNIYFIHSNYFQCKIISLFNVPFNSKRIHLINIVSRKLAHPRIYFFPRGATSFRRRVKSRIYVMQEETWRNDKKSR